MRIPLHSPLAPGDAHAWFARPASFTPEHVIRCGGILSAEERTRAERLRHQTDRTAFIVAHALLRVTLSAYLDGPPSGWTFEFAPRGKPRLAGRHAHSLEFSLTHTRGLVACAVARGPVVGVDVERVEAGSSRLTSLARYLSDDERTAAARLPAQRHGERFTELWTLKEAYLKATGEGLHDRLDTCSFRLGDDDRIELTRDGRAETGWRFLLTAPDDQSRLALAVAGREGVVAIGRAPPD